MLKCSTGNLEGIGYLHKLIRWKDTRDIAWSESSSVLSTIGINLEQALMIAAESGSNLNTVLGTTLALEDAVSNKSGLFKAVLRKSTESNIKSKVSDIQTNETEPFEQRVSEFDNTTVSYLSSVSSGLSKFT